MKKLNLLLIAFLLSACGKHGGGGAIGQIMTEVMTQAVAKPLTSIMMNTLVCAYGGTLGAFGDAVGQGHITSVNAFKVEKEEDKKTLLSIAKRLSPLKLSADSQMESSLTSKEKKQLQKMLDELSNGQLDKVRMGEYKTLLYKSLRHLSLETDQKQNWHYKWYHTPEGSSVMESIGLYFFLSDKRSDPIQPVNFCG